MNWLKKRAVSALSDIQEQGNMRLKRISQSYHGVHCVVEGVDYINFASNDYLGLAQASQVVEAGIEALESWGASGKSSTVVYGYTELHNQLEERLKTITGRSGAIIFPNAFTANHSVLAFMVRAEDVIFSEYSNHASLNHGLLASRARFMRFSIRDLSKLTQYLHDSLSSQPWIVGDHVLSVTGASAPVDAYVEIANDSGAILFIDDVHGFGVMGENGRSLFGCFDEGQVPLATLGFGKALGGYGGAVVGDRDLVEFLRQSARTYLYSTALPPYQIAMSLASLELMDSQPERLTVLKQNIDYFQAKSRELGLVYDDDAQTPIFSKSYDNVETAQEIYRTLNNAGFLVTLMRYPTVPLGTGCVRIALNYGHTHAMIDSLLSVMVTDEER